MTVFCIAHINITAITFQHRYKSCIFCSVVPLSIVIHFENKSNRFFFFVFSIFNFFTTRIFTSVRTFPNAIFINQNVHIHANSIARPFCIFNTKSKINFAVAMVHQRIHTRILSAKPVARSFTFFVFCNRHHCIASQSIVTIRSNFFTKFNVTINYNFAFTISIEFDDTSFMSFDCNFITYSTNYTAAETYNGTITYANCYFIIVSNVNIACNCYSRTTICLKYCTFTAISLESYSTTILDSYIITGCVNRNSRTTCTSSTCTNSNISCIINTYITTISHDTISLCLSTTRFTLYGKFLIATHINDFRFILSITVNYNIDAFIFFNFRHS